MKAKISPRRLLLYLIAFAIFMALFNLWGRTVENKDYLKYAEVGREILECNDWVILHEAGKIYAHKPPLHFWKIAGSYAIFGVNPFAARLPAALFALGGVLLTYAFGQRLLHNREIAVLAAVMLFSAYGYFWWARRTRIDMEFAILLSFSLVLFWFGVEAASRRRKTILYGAFWFTTGLAFLDKGPVAAVNLAIVLPYCVLTARTAGTGRIAPARFALTAPMLLLPVLAWIIPLVAHPEFDRFKEAYDQIVILKGREGPFYYLGQLPAKLFPLTPFVALGVWGYLRYRRTMANRRAVEFLLLWLGVYVVLLHLTSYRDHRYLLPTFLPSALFSAWAVHFALARYGPWFGRLLTLCDRLMLVGAVVSLVAPFIAAYHWKVSFALAVVYSVSLGVALVLARVFMPVRWAGLFISAAVLLQVIDVGDTMRNHEASPLLRLSAELKRLDLEPGEIAFYRCPGRTYLTVGYYFNTCLLRENDDWGRLRVNEAITAIVTMKTVADNEIPAADLADGWRRVALDDPFVLLMRDS